MSNNHPPSNNPPPLPGEQRSKQASAQVSRAQPDSKKHKPNKRSSLGWLWVLLLLIGGAGYWVWQRSITQQAMYGFQPPEMAMARYTPKDVIGDLGGLKVKIPRHYAEYVVYDGDPRFGEVGKDSEPERTFDSKLRNFGVKIRFPDMRGLESDNLINEYNDNFLKPESLWLRLVINSGENYPGVGRNYGNALAEKLWVKSEYWWRNYERLHEDLYGLEMYVVKGMHPKTGKLARESSDTEDIYIQRDSSGHVNTYIKCGRPAVPEGVGRCSLKFGLEPEAKVVVDVAFRPYLLPRWREIQESVRNFLLSFEVKEYSSSKY